jgi:hypothetical protein
MRRAAASLRLWSWLLLSWLLLSCAAAPGPLQRVSGRWSSAPAAFRGELVLRCEPEDAEVALDGVPQGTCQDYDGDPRGLALGTHRRRVAVSKAGFQRWESWMEADGTRLVVSVTLQRD